MAKVPAPEYPTLVERFIGLFHLPYLVGCVFVAFLVAFVGLSLAPIYLRTLDFGKAVAEWLPQTPAAAASYIISYIITLWLFYAPHYMRKKMLQAEAPISALLPNGEEDFHKHFGRVSALKPQLIIWISFLISMFTFIVLVFGFVPPLIELVLFIFSASIIVLGFASLVWTYFSSLWGIHRIGDASLNLRPHYKDRLLGLKPAGSLALSLVMAYFAFVGLFFMTGIVGSPEPLDPVAYALFSALVIPGLLMFILPLRTLHQRMLKQKKLERDRLEQRLDQIYQNTSEINTPSDLSQLFFSLSISDTMKKEISVIASWPVDVQILGRLIAVTLTVLGILIANAVRKFLGLP